MKNIIDRYFPPADLARIEHAVKAAEAKTAGEIVPYVVAASDDYEEAEMRAGCLFGGITILVFALMHEFSERWGSVPIPDVTLVVLLVGIAGILLVKYVVPLKRLFAGAARIERRIAQRAREAFVSEEVFNTRDRTGILLFVSLMEHRVTVLGDAGINAKVQHAAWEAIVQQVVDGIAKGKAVDGLVAAIQSCGDLLQQHGVDIRADDRNELGDSLRRGS